MLQDEKSSILKENQILIGVLNPYDNKDKIRKIYQKIKLIFFL